MENDKEMGGRALLPPPDGLRTYVNQFDFRPRLCGDCKSYVKGKRSAEMKGAECGWCIVRHEEVCRTDWCHDEDEVEAHKDQIRNYVSYEKRYKMK